MEQKLTYVNTHALLSFDTSISLLSRISPTASQSAATQEVLQRAIKHYNAATLSGSGGGGDAASSPDMSEPRLESFIVYLNKNQCETEVVHLALLEQFSCPGLCNESTLADAVSKHCEVRLKQLRGEDARRAALLAQWHQAYHAFRISASCLVKGADSFYAGKCVEALDLVWLSYTKSVAITEGPPKVHTCTRK